MTILETERLTRKISELLQNGGGSDIAAKIAGDFTAACHAANLRLQQCEAMIKAGDRHQAIQSAETAPNLLDLVTALEFRNADEWRLYCGNNALPVAERIDARSVQELNACYAQGIATDHPLYAAYRKAVLSRNDEGALKALQSITRLNPNDSNGAAELARLDAKVLSLKLENLGNLISGGDVASIIASIEAIEAFGFKSQPDGEIWRKAEAIRSISTVEEAAKLKASSQWAAVLAKLDFVKRLQKDHRLDLPAATLELINELQIWAEDERQKDKREKEFSSLLAELRYRIQQSEEKDTSARYVQLPEMKQDSEGLHKVWRALTDFTRPIPEEMTAAFRKRSGLIDAEIARRTAIRLRIILSGAVAAVVIVGVIAWLATERMKAKDFERQLQAAVAGHQANTTAQLVERLHTNEKGLLNDSEINSVLAVAETFVSEQKALQANFEAAFAKLPGKLNSEPNAAQINATADQLIQVRTALNALAPDLRQENEPRVNAFEQRWQQYLSEGGATINGILEQWITSAETLGDQLDYRASIETVSAQLTKLSGELQKINDCESGFTNHMSLRSDLLQRSGAIHIKYAAYNGELRKISDGLAQLKQAASCQDYNAALGVIASSEFSGTPIVANAAAIRSLGATEESTLRALLNATNPATWAYINKNTSAGFIPEMAMPAEHDELHRLFINPAVSAPHQHYRLWLDADHTQSQDWITAGFLDSTEGWKTIPAWTVSSSVTQAVFDDHEYGNFNGQMKLSPTQTVYRVDNIAETNITAAFNSVGLDKVGTGEPVYEYPLLNILDAIKDSREGSPVFRAYLFCYVVNIMEFQPDAWGLAFCPSARLDVKKIESITDGPINSGDWFIASKAANWGPKLDQFFATEKAMSYAKQATACLALLQATAKDGLRYIGYVAMDGKPVLATEHVPTEIWCFNAASKQPTLYQGSAAPLSPLFALPASRSDYLKKAGINVNGSETAGVLPPMFVAVE